MLQKRLPKNSIYLSIYNHLQKCGNENFQQRAICRPAVLKIAFGMKLELPFNFK